jgi:hypothetical protein
VAEAEAKPEATDELEAGRDRLRETVKWLVASFGAIAASLTLGSQLGNLGKLEGGRLAVAVIAAAVAFGGVIAALTLAVYIQVSSYVSFGQLGKEATRPAGEPRDELIEFFEDENPQYLGTYGTVASLHQAYVAAFKGDSADEQEAIATRVGYLMNAASYERLRRRFSHGLPWIIASVAVAAAATLAFAWAATGTEDKADATPAAPATTTPLAATPLPVVLSLRSQTAELLKQELGSSCQRSQLPALALRARGRAIEVVTLPGGRCRVARFVFGPEMGAVTPGDAGCRVERRRNQDVVVCSTNG